MGLEVLSGNSKKACIQRILEVRRGSGTYVINTNSLAEDPLGFGKIEDKYELALQLFEVRLMIEPEIASIACKNASEEDLLQLKSSVMRRKNCIWAGITT